MPKTVSAEGSETYLFGERLERKEINWNIVDKNIELLNWFFEQLENGELMILSRKEATCPICGYEIPNPHEKLTAKYMKNRKD